MEGILDNLTEKQRTTLKQFRKNLEDIIRPDHTDYYLLKFLRVGDFNLRKCERVFRRDFQNRTTFGIFTIVETYEKTEVAKRCMPDSILGFAKDGTLVHYMACGRLDAYGFIMSMSAAELCVYTAYMFEFDLKLLEKENLRTGKNIQEMTFIIDLEEFALQHLLHKNVIEMGIDFLDIVQDSYPELWKNVLVVNAPKVFDIAFNMFKPFMGSSIIDTLRVADKSSTKDLLLKYIDEDVLPAFLGGKRVDSKGDPRCREFIPYGGKVPEKLYSHHHRIALMPTDPGVKCVTIRPRSTYNHCVTVQEPGSKLRAQLRSEGGSVGIMTFFKEFCDDSNNGGFPAEDEYLDENAENSKYKQVSFGIRDQAHCTQEDALLNCVSAGIYIFRLTNVTNWFTSRKIFIKSELFPPTRNGVP